MKKTLLLIISAAILFIGCSKKGGDSQELTIYIYDSMNWIEKGVLKKFENANNCKINIVKFSSTSKISAQLILEKENPKSDIAIGITPAMLPKLKSEKVLLSYESENINKITNKDLIFDPEYYVTPYDYGSLAIIYNPAKIKNPPKTFDELLKYKNSIIIQDPRTSSTGMDFLLWTIAAKGNNWETFWKSFSKSVLTAAPGWSESFSKFENGEAPMMVSYATDGAYSVHNYGSYKYKAIIPENEGFIQIEGLSIVKGTSNKKLSRKFIDFFLSEDIQKEIPLNQWMFPVTQSPLPKAFEHAVKPKKIITMDPSAISESSEEWLSKWEDIMADKK